MDLVRERCVLWIFCTEHSSSGAQEWLADKGFWVEGLEFELDLVCRGLVVDTAYEIRVHPEAELGDIAQILPPWIDAGDAPADTNTQLALLIESKRGQHLVVYDAFPQLFKDMSKTHEQMTVAGLLAEPQTP
jgi:hypothetical protein